MSYYRLNIILLLAVFAFAPGCKRAPGESDVPPLELLFHFSERASLSDGAAVTMSGFDVGTVKSVTMNNGVDVVVSIDGEHKEKVRSKCYGRIHNPQLGSATLEIVVLDAKSPPIEDKAKRDGAVNHLQAIKIEAAHKGKTLIGDAKKTAVDAAKSASETVKSVTKKGVNVAKDAAEKGVNAAKELYKNNEGTIKRGTDAAKDAARKGAEATKKAAEKGVNMIKGLLE